MSGRLMADVRHYTGYVSGTAYPRKCLSLTFHVCFVACASSQVDDLRGTPLSVGTLEEIIDEK